MIAVRGRENMYIEYVCMQALFLGVRNSVEKNGANDMKQQ
jgi:hypothetical protein